MDILNEKSQVILSGSEEKETLETTIMAFSH